MSDRRPMVGASPCHRREHLRNLLPLAESLGIPHIEVHNHPKTADVCGLPAVELFTDQTGTLAPF